MNPSTRPPALKTDFDPYSRQLASDAVFSFWPDREIPDDIKDGEIGTKPLLEDATQRIDSYLIRSRSSILTLLEGSNNRDLAEAMLHEMLMEMTIEFARLKFESLIHERRSGLDELTGLPTRRVFNKMLKLAIDNKNRYGHDFSFIIFDLDHFKQVNDTYGHTGGDMVLMEMARRLSKDAKLRNVDSLARLGGEEFGAILPHTKKEGAAVLAERVSKQIGGTPFVVHEEDGSEKLIEVTASIGIAEYTKGDETGQAMIDEADRALYMLKGERPDNSGTTADNRGGIGFDGLVLNQKEINHFRRALSRKRSSLPPVKP